ncbi:serine--tRNA ligase [Phototrophicus methaneseepsis]|uniref:Serine--tRNA ligase n=1 Tax=Phototrophicus methaneseepsis TaxID=2710758 RepID=A0A7S8EDJ4_9CHLR|nr:serine--tRNA ligase [Phototrophicus methaneseepsis]QPC84859.1 serine--tRNA ligase [Phototrophicus methaneseepsis]
MLDIARIRQDPEWVKQQIRNLNDEPAAARVDTILELDERRRELIQQRDDLQASRNKLNKNFGRLRGGKGLEEAVIIGRAAAATAAIEIGDYDRADVVVTGQADAELPTAEVTKDDALNALMDALRDMGNRHGELDEEVKQIDAELEENMLWLPNLPHESVKVGMSDEENIIWQPEGEMPEFDFVPLPHWELGPQLGILDFEAGVKLAGSRFYVLKGWGPRLQRALISFYLDMAREKGFTELYVPYMVKEEMLYGSAQFPKFRDVVYYDQDADMYMLPTAEVAITNLHRDEILNEADLPLYYVAHTPCFRREKAAAGRDTRGIKRGHQFEKVEMYKFTTPEKSYEELESLTEAAMDVARKLGLPCRRIEQVTGDLGFSASKKYDVEVWAAGCEEWLEVSSCSNTEDFQARRAKIRYYPEGEKKAQFVHTLNGSGLAVPRVLIAVMENNQQADGSFIVPEALRPYLGGVERIGPEA